MSLGALFGAGVGAGLALLFAPCSGKEARQRIQGRVQEVVDEGRRAADERRLELTTRFEGLKQPGSGE